MEQSSYKKTIIEFQLAILKELYKNNKIGIKEYEYTNEIFQKKLNNIIVQDGLVSAVLDVIV